MLYKIYQENKRDNTSNKLRVVYDYKIFKIYTTYIVNTYLSLLYLKPTHALILKHTFTSTFIKTLKLVKNVL
jgi:hypothetical protein